MSVDCPGAVIQLIVPGQSFSVHVPGQSMEVAGCTFELPCAIMGFALQLAHTASHHSAIARWRNQTEMQMYDPEPVLSSAAPHPFWKPAMVDAGPMFPNRGDQDRFWRITRRFIEQVGAFSGIAPEAINAVGVLEQYTWSLVA